MSATVLAARFSGLVAGLALLGLAAAARADMLVAPATTEGGRPPLLLARAIDNDRELLIALGELAFKSTETLGINFSCDTCHPDGRASLTLSFPGLSNKPGNIDVTNRSLTMIEDGLFNPVNIPSVRGVAETRPFPRDGRFADLRDFTLFVSANEFPGPVPTELGLDALVAFQESLPFADNPLLDDAGNLRADAAAAARRGEQLFQRPFPARPDLSCARCHRPASAFVDGDRHDVGTGKALDTPTLRDLAWAPPYMHDGRFESLDRVVDYFDGFFDIGLSPAERADLLAYLAAIGGGDQAPPVAAIEPRIGNAVKLLARTLDGADHALTNLVIEQVDRELDQWAERGGPAEIADWRALLRRIEPFAAGEDYQRAKDVLNELAARIASTHG